MSVKERFAEAILGQQKRYELRRVRPRIASGSVVWLYATKPCGAVVGWFEAGDVISAPPPELWKRVGQQSGVSRAEFVAYFTGCDTGHAIEVRRSVRTPRRPLPDAGRAPQSYRYLNVAEIASIAVT
jgi:predicted transcriptional regulator